MNKQDKNYISKASNKMVGLVLARKQKKKRENAILVIKLGSVEKTFRARW